MLPTLICLAGLAPLTALAYTPSNVLLVARATSSDTPQSPSTTTNTDTCDPSHNGLATGTLQYVSDCNATTFCQSDGTCKPKGCRRDEFPLGYPPSGVKADGVKLELPDKCANDQFCPDEGSSCQPLIAVGGACQLDRDDACQAPDDFKELRDTSGFGLNVNGSVCLNFVCMWANATVGTDCVVENVGYITYGANGSEFVDIVSRDNCKIGSYCDATQSPHVCVARKAIGVACAADKECTTFNCDEGTCGEPVDTPRRFSTWIYIVIGVCIFGGMIGTLLALFFFHRRHRDTEREKRLQYWREQNAFRQNILQMQESARASVFSASQPGSRRSSAALLFGTLTEDSQAPMLQHQGRPGAGGGGSGLKYYESAEGGSYAGSVEENDGLVMRQPYGHGTHDVKPSF